MKDTMFHTLSQAAIYIKDPSRTAIMNYGGIDSDYYCKVALQLLEDELKITKEEHNRLRILYISGLPEDKNLVREIIKSYG